jgi:hypothetical protein
MSAMAIVLYASRLAGFAGLHKYADPLQALIDQWYFTDTAGCVQAILDHGTADVNQHLLTDAQVAAYNSVMERAMAAPDAKAFADVLRSESDPAVQERVRAEASKARGTRDEGRALDQYEVQTGLQVTDRNDKLYRYEVSWGDVPPPTQRKVVIVGRVDGIADGQLTEVKNRMKGFFAHIPLYERVQVQCYMKMTGLTTCRFVQRYNDQIREEVEEFDDHFWNVGILPSLARSIEQLEALLQEDVETQRRLLASGKLPEKYVERKQKRKL